MISSPSKSTLKSIEHDERKDQRINISIMTFAMKCVLDLPDCLRMIAYTTCARSPLIVELAEFFGGSG